MPHEKKHSNTRKADHAAVPPLIDDDCTVLMLGSMLSPKSAQAEFYYAHPQNRFWRVLFALFGSDYSTDRADRAALALSHRIALWDVLSCCDMAGAADSTIKNAEYNDIAGLLNKHPRITRIYTTGGKAHELLMRYNATAQNEIISRATRLPSTSPLNCKMSLQDLITAYSAIK